MKTIIKTNIKDSRNVEVKESVSQVFDSLIMKGSFVMLTRISTMNQKQSNVILSKSYIKMVKEQ